MFRGERENRLYGGRDLPYCHVEGRRFEVSKVNGGRLTVPRDKGPEVSGYAEGDFPNREYLGGVAHPVDLGKLDAEDEAKAREREAYADSDTRERALANRNRIALLQAQEAREALESRLSRRALAGEGRGFTTFTLPEEENDLQRRLIDVPVARQVTSFAHILPEEARHIEFIRRARHYLRRKGILESVRPERVEDLVEDCASGGVDYLVRKAQESGFRFADLEKGEEYYAPPEVAVRIVERFLRNPWTDSLPECLRRFLSGTLNKGTFLTARRYLARVGKESFWSEREEAGLATVDLLPEESDGIGAWIDTASARARVERARERVDSLPRLSKARRETLLRCLAGEGTAEDLRRYRRVLEGLLTEEGKQKVA